LFLQSNGHISGSAASSGKPSELSTEQQRKNQELRPKSRLFFILVEI